MDRCKESNFQHIEDVAMGRVNPDGRFYSLLSDPEYEERYYTIIGIHHMSKKTTEDHHEICKN